MHTEDQTLPNLDIPYVAMDIPFVELELEDLPSIDELLRRSPVMCSPPLTINQTPFSERICIRINRGVLEELKKRAADEGTRYQSYINLLLAQHAAT